MTNPDQSLKPGRELDALVAEKVMGWKTRWQEGCYECLNVTTLPPYSTDISAAWEMIDKIFGKVKIESCGYGTHPWVVTFWKDGTDWPSAGTTAPHAICLAALKAVGALND